MNLNPQIHHLSNYAAHAQWLNATAELCRAVISKILASPPKEESWLALQELMAAWPNADDIKQWVADLEPKIDHWFWTMRHSILGQQHTRGEKQCVYRLVGYLHINNIEDGGQKLRRWSENPHWQNLKGIGLYKVETEAEHLADFLDSPYLKNLETLELKALDPLSGKLDIVLGKTQLPHLIELNLLSLNLKATDLMVLANTVIGKQLRKLDLTGNFIYDRDLPLILNPASFPNMEALNISHTTLSAAALKKALTPLDHPVLKQLVFKGTPAAEGMGHGIIDDL